MRSHCHIRHCPVQPDNPESRMLALGNGVDYPDKPGNDSVGNASIKTEMALAGC